MLTLTKAGYAQADLYARQAREHLGAMLDGIDPGARDQLVQGMDAIESSLSGSLGPVELRDLEAGDVGWVVQRHGELYLAEEGFDHTFEALVAEILAAFLRKHDPLNERAFIAHRGSQR